MHKESRYISVGKKLTVVGEVSQQQWQDNPESTGTGKGFSPGP
jgi:hypothetical protein